MSKDPHGWWRATKRFDLAGDRWATNDHLAVVEAAPDSLDDVSSKASDAIGSLIEQATERVRWERLAAGYHAHDIASQRVYRSIYVLLVEARHPGCEWRVGSSDLSACVAFVGDRSVGIVMPIRSDGDGETAPYTKPYTKPMRARVCPTCDAATRCAKCDGEGECSCVHCGDDHECRACGGCGRVRVNCGDCDGTGRWQQEEAT